MAYHDAQVTHSIDFPHRVLAAVKSFFSMVGHAMVAGATANRRLQVVERLQQKTDAELAEMGMKREDIIRRVFMDMIDV